MLTFSDFPSSFIFIVACMTYMLMFFTSFPYNIKNILYFLYKKVGTILWVWPTGSTSRSLDSKKRVVRVLTPAPPLSAPPHPPAPLLLLLRRIWHECSPIRQSLPSPPFLWSAFRGFQIHCFLLLSFQAEAWQ